MIIELFLFAALVSQAGEPAPETSGKTNSGETFKDPFANEEQVQPSPSPESPSPAQTPPQVPTPAQPQPTAPENSLNGDPSFEEVNPRGPVIMDSKPVIPPPPSQAQEPKKLFSFPADDKDLGPITQDVRRYDEAAAETKLHGYNIGIAGGAGLNVNKRPQQIHLELNGGWRAFRLFEVGGVASIRFVDDKLYGLLLTGKGFWTFTAPPTMRMDLAYGGALGWTLRTPRHAPNEQRLTSRLQFDYLVYPFPKFALVTSAALEVFLLSMINGTGVNLFKNNGPPSQLLIMLGTRWEF